MWCVVFAAAPIEPRPGLIARVAGAARVVAADGGAATALAFGLTPDVVIGDLDSIDPATVDTLQSRGVPIDVVPTDKDATDGELAVRQALAWGSSRITMVGALGGDRADHGLANIMLQAHADLAAVTVTLLDNRHEVRLLLPGQTWQWTALLGEFVSLLPFGGPASGVRADGLRWPLRDERLESGSTRGVSNEAVSESVTVSIASGRLLVTRHLPPGVDDWTPTSD